MAFEHRYRTFFLPSIFLLFYPGAFIAAVLGGTGPAMLNVGLSATGAFWIFHDLGPERLEPSSEILLRFGFFASFATFGCWLIGRGRLAAQALRESEAALRIFRALADNSSDFIGIADPDGVPIYVNPSGRALVGLPEDLPVGKTRIPEYYPPDMRPFATGVILKAMREQGHWKGETWFRNFQTDERIPVWDEHFMIRDARGDLLGMGTVTRDLSDRCRAEEEVGVLRETERFRLALEAAASAMLVVDRGGRIAFANAKAERMFGWTREELVGQSIEILVPHRFRGEHPGQRESFHREGTFQRPMGAGRDLYALRKDGTEFPVEIGLTRVTEGGQEFVVSSHIDIAVRKKAEAALRESEQRFRLLVQGTRDYAIHMHDLEGLLTVWNEGAERIFGWRADEIMGRPVSTFYAPEDVAQDKPAQDLSMAAAKGSVELEGWRQRKDGSRFWASVLITCLRDSSGKPLGYGKVTRDLSEKRKKDQELEDSHARLRQTVAELESFAYTISHDLRAPLRTIEGHSHLLLQNQGERLDPESRALLQTVRQAAVRLDRLIRDLLSYAAIARKPVELEAVDLDDLLTHVARHYPEVARVRIHLRAPLGNVRGQSSLLLQAVSNLLDNAVKFVPEGREPKIEVWTERLDTGAIRLVVKDNGIGIPKEAAAQMFKPFARLHPKGVYAGTGIGLAIVKKAAERMGGRAGFESTPGQGSRFFIELPEA